MHSRTLKLHARHNCSPLAYVPCISLCFTFPPISENFFGSRGKLPRFDLFPQNFLISIRQNFWRPLFSLTTNFEFLPLFPCFNSFPPYFEKILFSPYFCKIPPPNFLKLTCLYVLYVYFAPPTFTMMHLCITQCTYWTTLLNSSWISLL